MNERRILESWKAIAAYLDRTEKTCQKWEHELSLPVHRLEDSARARVFAYVDELDRWKEEKLRAGTTQVARGRLGKSSKRRFWLFSVAALAVIAVVATLLIRRPGPSIGPAGSPAAKSIAVLPFVDLSPGESQEHISDGISDILINTLNRVKGLRIPARTSAFYFKGKDITPAEIGRKLKVDWLLEGSVQIDGNRLRVAANLFRASDGTTLWAERYDRERYDIFAVEDEIAQKVAKALAVNLLGEPGAPVADPGTQNPDAYNLFLRGRRSMDRGREFLKPAITFFDQALAKDPDFAEAQALISRCYFGLGHIGKLPMAEAYPKAKAAAARALAIDPDNSSTLGTLASMKLIYDLDFAGAEEDIKKAIQNHPADSQLHAIYANVLSAAGRGEEALQEANLAAELDPLSSGSFNMLAMRGYYYSRQYEPALEALKKALELDPYDAGTFVNFLAVHLAMGRFEEARTAQQRRREILGSPADTEGQDVYFALVHAYAGQEAEARNHLARIEEVMMRPPYVAPAMIVAWVHAALGDKDEAFAWLEKAVQEKEGSVYRLKVEPLIDPLRDDPRFSDLLRRIGLEL